MKRYYLLLASVALLAGCAQDVYFLNGQKYDTPSHFKAAATADRNNYIEQIKPLPIPLSPKMVVLTMPSREYLLTSKLAYARHFNPNTQMPAVEANPLVSDYIEFLQKLPEMVRRKNLFSAVDARVVDGPSEVQPSKDYDVITLSVATSVGARDEFFYISQKSGRQIIQADSSTVSSHARWDSMFDSLKAAMLR